jgi:hypothetical protein
MPVIIFCHHASISGIPSGSAGKVFETDVALKKNNDNDAMLQTTPAWFYACIPANIGVSAAY